MALAIGCRGRSDHHESAHAARGAGTARWQCAARGVFRRKGDGVFRKRTGARKCLRRCLACPLVFRYFSRLRWHWVPATAMARDPRLAARRLKRCPRSIVRPRGWLATPPHTTSSMYRIAKVAASTFIRTPRASSKVGYRTCAPAVSAPTATATFLSRTATRSESTGMAERDRSRSCTIRSGE